MHGRMRLVAAFIGGILVMAAAFGVYGLATSNNSDNGNAVQNVATSTSRPSTNGTTSNTSSTSGACTSGADIYATIRPSVVEVDIVGNGAFGGTVQGTGTGIVLDKDGHILTNNHVVDGASTVNVLFDDGATVQADIVGTDSQNDLAVIKIDPSKHDLTPAKLGDSSNLRVGDTVYALGNPFNLEGSFTAGIVSGLDRTYSEGNSTRPIRGMIQTDAPINPGNSGGPLINCQGEVVGINTLLDNPTGQDVNVGVGFAVAINTAKAEIDSLKASQTVQHAWLGIAGLDVTTTLKEQLNLTVDKGVYVTLVTNGSPADDAGLVGAFSSQNQAQNANPSEPPPSGGDVILSADGHDMSGIDQLAQYLDQNKRPGQTVELGIVRDGQQQTVTATLAEWPSA